MSKQELKLKIKKLPQEHSLVLSLILLEKLSYTEVADIIGCTKEKAEKLYLEARDLLLESNI